jgi:methionine-rich copper-binding protein CopC
MPARSAHSSERVFLLPVRIAGLALLLMMVCPAVHAHADLQLQIDALSRQLTQDPDNVELLLRRGDLQRRHENWDLARADFKHVRNLQPENATVDWFEGRLEVQAGQPVEGVRYLDRFLSANPGHLIALQNRAQGYLLLNQPLLAANDYQTVILASARPAPSLYRANALALIRAGAEHFSTAMEVVLEGLSDFPAEVTLTAIATDLSLARSDTVTAKRLMSRLPAPVLNLPQWQTRNALLECQSGYTTKAAAWFSSAVDPSNGPGQPPGLLSVEWLARLAAEPDPENCQAAVIDILNNLKD